MRRLILGLLAAAISSPALAQSSPGLVTGQVPTAAQWNSYFAAKQDVLGFTPLNIAGGVMTGRLVTAAPTTGGSGFRLPHGTAPSSPTNGDFWTTTVGVFAQINGSTIALTGSGSGSFAATSPLAVSFPAGVVTYAITGTSGGVLAGAGPAFTATPTLGVPGATLGTLAFAGNTSGTVTVRPQAAAGTPTLTFPTTTGTFAVAATAPVALSAITGTISITGAAGQVLAGAGPAFTATPTLGVAGTTVGTLAFANATSGSITLQPTTGALGSSVITMPATTGTMTVLGNTTTGSGSIVLATSPTLVTPVLGVATGTSFNGLTISTTTGTFTLTNAKTFFVSNSITLAGTDSTTWTGPSTNATLAALNIQNQTLSGGANVTSLSLSTGSVTIDCGSRPLQFITNGGAFTLTAPANDGSCIVMTTNNGSAGTITFSGFTVGSSTGDSLTTANGSKFSIMIWRINGTAGYRVAAHQ